MQAFFLGELDLRAFLNTWFKNVSYHLLKIYLQLITPDGLHDRFHNGLSVWSHMETSLWEICFQVRKVTNRFSDIVRDVLLISSWFNIVATKKWMKITLVDFEDEMLPIHNYRHTFDTCAIYFSHDAAKMLKYHTFTVVKYKVCHGHVAPLPLILSDFRCTSSIYTWAKYLTCLSLWCVLPGGRGLSAEDLQGMSELGGLRGLEGRSAGAGSVHSAERRLSAHRRERAQWPQSGGQ